MSKKMSINIEFDLDSFEDRMDYAMLSQLLAHPYKPAAVVSRFYTELIRPVNKHGYSDETLQKLSEMEGGSELINLLWHRFVDIIKEEEADY